jgi:hypothetical protein
MTHILRPIALVLVLAALAACGSTKTERGLSGAAVGAGAGALGGAVLGDDSIAEGAILGAAAGAAVGLLTDSDDLDLDDVFDD